MKNWKRIALAVGGVLVAVLLAVVLWRMDGAPEEGTLPSPEPSPSVSAVPTPAPSPSSTPEVSASTSPSASPTPSPDATSAPTVSPTPQPSEAPAALTCSVSIRCDTILDNLDLLDPEKTELVPADGVLLTQSDVTFEEGESAFDLLKQVCQDEGVHLEFSITPGYGSAYIEGIGNLYEFDCGERSGWLYQVNDQVPDRACSEYLLQANDKVEFLYSCDWGQDLT